MHGRLLRLIQSFHLSIKRLHYQYANLDHFLDASPCVVYALDPKTFKPRYVSPNSVKLYQEKPEKILSEHNWWEKRLHPDDRDKVLKRFKTWALRGCHNQVKCTYRIKKDAGSWIWVQDQLTAVRNRKGSLVDLIGAHIDITEQKQHEQQLKRLADYDSLTGLPNREFLKRILPQAMEKACKAECKLALCCIDLDNFKHINDCFGRNAGDVFLQEISKRLITCMRDNDTVARVGGDEFVVILQHLDTEHDYEILLDQIQTAIAIPFKWNGIKMQTTSSTGITLYPQQEEHNSGRLLRQANYSMYKAKLKGKNGRYLFSIDKQRSQVQHNQKLERISTALKQNELELFYQPKVNMRTEKVLGVEALVRWHHPERGLQSPAEFLPYIQNHPLDIELGLWVIDTAMKQIETWHKHDLDLPVSVNVSGYHLQQPDFIDLLHQMLTDHPGVRHGDLEIEILETAAIKDIKRVSNVIAQCRTIGVNVALDDFGTGYSSLSYLKNLPVQTLKIDQSFICEICDKPDDLAIFEGILGMARAFGRQVVAEGIETVEQGHMLLQLSCELAQGYEIARPMPAQDLPEWINNWKADSSWKKARILNNAEFQRMRVGIAHRAWLKDLEQYLQNNNTAPPDMNPERCIMGAWLKSAAAENRSNRRSAAEIMGKYLQIHEVAREAIDLHHRGMDAEAQTHLTGLRGLSTTLLEQFMGDLLA